MRSNLSCPLAVGCNIAHKPLLHYFRTWGKLKASMYPSDNVFPKDGDEFSSCCCENEMKHHDW